MSRERNARGRSQSEAMKFEDRSLGKTARQARCARGDAWELAKSIFQAQKKEDKATCYSTSEEWIMSAASTTNPQKKSLWSRKTLTKPNWRP